MYFCDFGLFYRLDQIFSDTFTRDYQLMSTDPCRHVYLAAALLVRGAISASDLRRNIDKQVVIKILC